jgi:hypothetical protein
MMHPKQSAVQRYLGKPEANGAAAANGGADKPPVPSAVQRYLGQEPPPPGMEGMAALTPDQILERKSYCILRGRLPLPPTFRLINLQGRWRSFDYAALTGANMDNPQELLLHYEGRECYTLTVGGLDLDRELADAFDDKRVLWVRELDELVAAKIRKDDPGEPVVRRILIAEGMVSRAWDAEPGSRQTGLPARRGRGESA